MYFGKKENTTGRHVATPGCATGHADVSMGSVFADVIMVNADVSLTKSTVTRSAVSGSHESVAPPVSLMPEADMWVPRVSPC